VEEAKIARVATAVTPKRRAEKIRFSETWFIKRVL
jgi:hypothetical protein